MQSKRLIVLLAVLLLSAGNVMALVNGPKQVQPLAQIKIK